MYVIYDIFTRDDSGVRIPYPREAVSLQISIAAETLADSDVDVLVEFQPGHVPGLDFVRVERELSAFILETCEPPAPLP